MTMSAHRTHTASEWAGGFDTPEWPKRLGTMLSAAAEAIEAGLAAKDDYRKLASHGVTPQAASETIFRKHFGRR
jgi:hypothetical protein